jgi:hypothetical protein
VKRSPPITLTWLALQMNWWRRWLRSWMMLREYNLWKAFYSLLTRSSL